MKKLALLFRTDGSSQIGFGHVMRCLALAEGIEKLGVKCIFVIGNSDKKVLEEIHQKGHLIEQIPTQSSPKNDFFLTAKAVNKYNATAVVTDSYDISAKYLRQLKSLGVFVISIDDTGEIHFPSDVILNQNVTAKKLTYSKEDYTQLLLGPKYVLLRGEFAAKHAQEREISKEVKSILVTMGGGDPDNQTLKVARAIEKLNQNSASNITTTIIMGTGYLYEEVLKKELQISNKRFALKSDVKNMSDLMIEADIAINGGGSTCYELACLGVPNIILVLADNQRENAQELHDRQISMNLGDFKNVSPEDIKSLIEDLIGNVERRKLLSSNGKRLVDGKGVDRVVEFIASRIINTR